jgi:ribosomal protein L11 methylase PrmA
MQNSVGNRDGVQVWQGSLGSVPAAEWDVVVVNILAAVIIQLLAGGGLMKYVAATGYLVLSGIIDQQAADVRKAIQESGGEVIQTLTVRDWVTYIVQHSSHESHE